MSLPSITHPCILIALWIIPGVLPVLAEVLPAWEFDHQSVTTFDVRHKSAAPLIDALESSTRQKRNSISSRLAGSVRACGNWAAFNGTIQPHPSAAKGAKPLAVLFLKSPNGWLVVDIAGGNNFAQRRHWPASFNAPEGLLEEPAPSKESDKPGPVSEKPNRMSATLAEPTPLPNPQPVSAEPSSERDEKKIAALRVELEQLQDELNTLRNQLKDLPEMRDSIPEAEIARNVKKFEAMGKDFAPLKDSYLESVEREREKHTLANSLRQAIDTTEARIDEITRKLQVSDKQ